MEYLVAFRLSRHRAWVMGQRLSYVCRDLVVGLSRASGRQF